MDPARAQGGADACAAIEAKKPVAVHGRSAPQATTQERTHEDRRGQDDDRSRRRSAGDYPAGPRIAAPAGVARDEPDESRAAIRRDGTNVRKGGGSAVRCRGNSRQAKQVSASGPQGFRTRSRGGRWIEVEADGAGVRSGRKMISSARPAISYLSRRINRREAWDERLVVSARRHCDAHRSDGCDRRSRPLAEGCQSP